MQPDTGIGFAHGCANRWRRTSTNRRCGWFQPNGEYRRCGSSDTGQRRERRLDRGGSGDGFATGNRRGSKRDNSSIGRQHYSGTGKRDNAGRERRDSLCSCCD